MRRPPARTFAGDISAALWISGLADIKSSIREHSQETHRRAIWDFRIGRDQTSSLLSMRSFDRFWQRSKAPPVC